MKKVRIILAILVFSLLISACAAADFAPAPVHEPSARDTPASAPDSAFDAAPAPVEAPMDDFGFFEEAAADDFGFAEEAPAMDDALMMMEVESAPEVPSDGARRQASAPATPSAPPPAQAQYNEATTAIPILTPSVTDRKLIYTVNIELQTTSFMSGIRILRETVGEMGGYIVSESVNGRDIRTPEVERNSTSRYRLPSEQLANFLVVVEDNFNLLSLRLSTDEATVEYRHAENQLEDLREQESRILEYLENDYIDVFERAGLESVLTDVQRLISEFMSVQAAIDDGVVYSTITISLFEAVLPELEVEEDEEEEEEEIIPPTFSERLSDALTRSANVLASFGQGLLLVVIAIMPVLIILGVFAAIAVAIIIPLRKRRKKKAASNPNPNQNPMNIQGYYPEENK